MRLCGRRKGRGSFVITGLYNSSPHGGCHYFYTSTPTTNNRSIDLILSNVSPDDLRIMPNTSQVVDPLPAWIARRKQKSVRGKSARPNLKSSSALLVPRPLLVFCLSRFQPTIAAQVINFSRFPLESSDLGYAIPLKVFSDKVVTGVQQQGESATVPDKIVA